MCCNYVRSFATPLLLVIACCAVGSAQEINLAYNGNGGAYRAVNADLDLRNISLVDNAATGYGGAIYFEVNGRNTQTLQLGATGTETREMTRNLHWYDNSTNSGTPNSITFAGAVGNANDYGHIVFEMSVEGNNFFSIRDPLYVVPNSNLILDIEKTGKGTWNLDGASDLSGAVYGARFNVREGTLVLGNGSSLIMNSAHRGDELIITSGAELRIGNTGITGAGVDLRTSHFWVANNASLFLDKDLALTLYGQSTVRNAIDGVVSGSGGLTLRGDGTLEFAGTTNNYSGNLNLAGGKLILNSSSGFETTGHVELGKNTTLSVFITPDQASISAQSITINDTFLEITGVYSGTGTYTLLESNSEIKGDFTHSSTPGTSVTYMTTRFGFSSTDPNSADYRRRYEATIDLRWDANLEDGDPTDPENGLFDIDPTGGAPDYFTVGTALQDNTSVGKTLIKRGRGTLELATENDYFGDTVIEAGTLKLTHFLGAGSQGDIRISSGGALELDFVQSSFAQKVTGSGKVVKSGTGTVRMTNTANDYTGGTVIQSGTLSVADLDVLGDELKSNITFEGGKLLLEKSKTAYTLKQTVIAGEGSDAWFESISDLTITSTIRGDGGLRKTGTGALMLAGQGVYHGDTKIEEGTLIIANANALGNGNLVLSDGVRFQNNTAFVNARDVVLKYEGSRTPDDGVLFDIQGDLVQNGAVSGAGKLVKVGNQTLTLSGKNSFSGGLLIQEGTVEFSSQENLGAGMVTFDGGQLRNTAVIENLDSSLTAMNGQAIRLDTPYDITTDTYYDMTITSDIKGDGGLHKSGGATLTLTGANSYRGETRVSEGVLINNGSLDSPVYVEGGAALGGNGTVYDAVYFQPGSAYQWTLGLTEQDSTCLTIRSDVHLSGTFFRPMTAGATELYPTVIDNWTVLRYTGELAGDQVFAGIDNSFSPFYDFELDYSQGKTVKVTGYHRRDPRPLSDSVAMGIVMAQRRVHRRAFEQLDKELQGGRNLGLGFARSVNGQSAGFSSHLWADFYGRASEYESSYHKDNPWRMTSFGAQIGYSILSSNWLSFGITAGVEFPKLKNYLDQVKATDGFIGLYYGQRIYGMWELKGYLGGGSQRYKSCRSDTKYNYRSTYRGDSFETSIELGRPILLGQCMVRPHIGFDLGYAGQQASKEDEPSKEYRTYSDVSLTQLYVRVGIDLQRSWEQSDGFFGVSYSNMIGGQSLPSVRVFYPSSNSGTTVYGTKLGQNMFTLKTGGNLYLDNAKCRSFFLNLTADIFTDRQNGKAEFTGSLGYDYRF